LKKWDAEMSKARSFLGHPMQAWDPSGLLCLRSDAMGSTCSIWPWLFA